MNEKKKNYNTQTLARLSKQLGLQSTVCCCRCCLRLWEKRLLVNCIITYYSTARIERKQQMKKERKKTHSHYNVWTFWSPFHFIHTKLSLSHSAWMYVRFRDSWFHWRVYHLVHNIILLYEFILRDNKISKNIVLHYILRTVMSSCNCLLALEFHSNCKCTRTNAAALELYCALVQTKQRTHDMIIKLKLIDKSDFSSGLISFMYILNMWNTINAMMVQ